MSQDLKKRIETARGDRPADMVLKAGRIVNVFSRQILEADIAIADGVIAGVGRYTGRRTIDLAGRYVAPGFIDPHVHIESAMVSVAGFACAVAPHGTTCVVADPHEIANVLGLAGIRYMLRSAENQPVDLYFTLSSCVPATDMETAGARLEAKDLSSLISHPRILGLAEMMNFPGVICGQDDVLAKIRLARAHHKQMDGHAPGLSGLPLQAYLCVGIHSDHECTALEEAREKLNAGMHVMIREGTGAKNLDALLPLVEERTCRRLMWCTDDRHPHDLIQDGHIDGIVRKAIRLGLDPLMAIQMATLNPAEYFGIADAGGIAPGRRADLIVFSDLSEPRIETVFCGGKIVAEDGRIELGTESVSEQDLPSSMNLNPGTVDLSLRAEGKRIRVIDLVPGQIVTRASLAEAAIDKGMVCSDPRQDVLKLAVVERYSGKGGTGIGFVRGFRLRRGALASSVAHDSHNIVCVGVEEGDMKAAIEAVARMGGGLAVAAGGKAVETLALPLAGLMSPEPIETVRRKLDRLTAAARELGTAPKDPFMTLSFLALPVIPELKLTDKGLVDVAEFRLVSVFAA